MFKVTGPDVRAAISNTPDVTVTAADSILGGIRSPTTTIKQTTGTGCGFHCCTVPILSVVWRTATDAVHRGEQGGRGGGEMRDVAGVDQ